jgi:hypothetical protein
MRNGIEDGVSGIEEEKGTGVHAGAMIVPLPPLLESIWEGSLEGNLVLFKLIEYD